jgi:hypothetical protein
MQRALSNIEAGRRKRQIRRYYLTAVCEHVLHIVHDDPNLAVHDVEGAVDDLLTEVRDLPFETSAETRRADAFLWRTLETLFEDVNARDLDTAVRRMREWDLQGMIFAKLWNFVRARTTNAPDLTQTRMDEIRARVTDRLPQLVVAVEGRDKGTVQQVLTKRLFHLLRFPPTAWTAQHWNILKGILAAAGGPSHSMYDMEYAALSGVVNLFKRVQVSHGVQSVAATRVRHRPPSLSSSKRVLF